MNIRRLNSFHMVDDVEKIGNVRSNYYSELSKILEKRELAGEDVCSIIMSHANGLGSR